MASPSPSMSEPVETGRRSVGVADISQLIEGMFPSEGVLLSKDLLPLIHKVETEQDIRIFGPDETTVVEGIVAEHPDLELSLSGLLDLLVAVIPPAPAASPFQQPPTVPSLPSSSPETPSGRPRHKRSSSARIRSASDTSSSDSDSPALGSSEPTLTFPSSISAPDILSAASSSESLPGTLPHQPIRRKVLSNASSDGGMMAADQAVARVRGTPEVGGEKAVKPPSSWERFQRPGAPSRSGRRRKSASAAASSAGRGGGASEAGSDHEGGENLFNPPQTPTQGGPQRPGTGKGSFIRSRQTSQPIISTPGGTPTHPSHSHHQHSNSLGSRSFSDNYPLAASSPPPGSPVLDETSFQSLSGMMRSPLDSPQEDYGLEGSLERQQRESMSGGSLNFPGMRGHGGRDLSLGVDGAEGDGEAEAGALRLVRDSTASAHSISSFHDSITALDKVNNDLTRKLKAAQQELENTASEHERIALDYQDRLEDLRNEVTGKRREEKELRGKERDYLIQIQTFESDISKLHRSLESQKATYSTLLKNYTEQCNVSEELRNSIRGKDTELREAQENLDGMKSDLDKWNREREYLEEINRSLLTDLDTARQAEAFLDDQKLENLALKETINRLRGDLDELRTMSTAGGSGNNSISRAGRPNSIAGGRPDSMTGTLGRSLEKELLRQLRAGDGEGASGNSSGMEEGAELGGGEDGSTQDGEDSFIEEFITTSRRRRRVLGTRSDNPVTVEIQDAKEIIEYSDAAVQATSPEVARTEMSIQTDDSMLARLPAYTPRLEDELAAAKTSSSSRHEDATLLLSPSSSTSSSRRDTSSSTLRRRERDSVVQHVYNTFHYSTPSDSPDDSHPRSWSQFALRLAPWVVVSLILGYFYGYHDASHPPLDPFGADLAQWSHYNTIARAQGAGVGFAPAEWDPSALAGILGVVGATADKVRRVPT